MLPVLEIPIFEGDLEEKISQVVSWVDERVERKKWSNEEIEEKFTKRDSRQILEEGHTCYMNPCLDINLVVYEVLRTNAFNPIFVIQELTYNHSNHLHFAIEFNYQEELYFLDIVAMNHVSLKKGKYHHHKESIKSLQIIRMDGDFNPNDAPLSSIGENFKPIGFDLDLQLARLKRDNTPKTYENYLARIGDNKKLYLNFSI